MRVEGKRHIPELHGSRDQNTHFQGPPQIENIGGDGECGVQWRREGCVL